MDILVYDCEIKKAISGRGRKEQGVQYCDGWHDHDRMGVSVIGAYDYREDRYRVFMDDNIDVFKQLVYNRKLIVGFNSKAFDNKLVAATYGLKIEDHRSYDLLLEIWKGAGLEPYFCKGTHEGYGLDACARINLGVGKIGHGEGAPKLYQRGRYGELTDYCIHDVYLTKRLLDKVIMEGCILNPNAFIHPEYIHVERPRI